MWESFNGLHFSSRGQDRGNALQIGLRVHADGGVGRLLYVDRDVVREQAKLFQTLG